MEIITKFAIATDEETAVLMKLAKELAYEKFSEILGKEEVETYINENFSARHLTSEMNSMSNQWLLVKVDNHPAGYAKITSKGKIPSLLENKRAARIADFAILKKYATDEVKNVLFNKCFSVCKHLEGIWINEYTEHPLINFFESKGFVKQKETRQHDELNIPSLCFIYLNN